MHLPFDSVDDLLAPDFLGDVIGTPVVAVQNTRLIGDFAHSGSELRSVVCELAPSRPPIRFVLKRLNHDADWLMRATDDHSCRSVTLWRDGILDRLPAILDAAVVACSADENGWAILMHDIGDYFVTDTYFSPEQDRRFVRAMAALHATFFEDIGIVGRADAPGDKNQNNLSEIGHVYTMFAPETARRETARDSAARGKPATGIHERIIEGWEGVREICPTDVVDTITALLEDSTPLVSALEQYPATLVHGDFRHSNLAALPDGRVGLVDWQLAVAAPPSVELGRYIGANSPFLAQKPDDVLEAYRSELATLLGARFNDEWWRPQLELGLLGGFVQDGWAIALKATTWHVGAKYREHWKASLSWWAECVRRGKRWLSR